MNSLVWYHHNMDIRTQLEKREELLHPSACRSINGKRLKEDTLSPTRTEFQRDRDRIIHSKAFRRLKHKTQVFISPEGDHYRTRLTHTLEVSQIARTIAKALNLNEDLTEAIALGHDLGHTPFGHTGEDVLNDISGGNFKHNFQSLRVVKLLEKNGKGLNLTTQVMDGIVKHSKGSGPIITDDPAQLPSTLEGQIVRLSDIIAYVNHDLDDAVRSSLIKEGDIPEPVRSLFGSRFSRRIDTIVNDVISSTIRNNWEYISMSEEVYKELNNLRSFLFAEVYKNDTLERERNKIESIITSIYRYVLKNPTEYLDNVMIDAPNEKKALDFIAGMTDNFALQIFKQISIPEFIV